MKKVLTSLMLLAVVGCASPITGAGVAGAVTIATEQISVKDSKKITNAREGKACIHNVLGIVVFGDGSIDNAMKSSGIKDVYSVKAEKFGILGVYANSCTIIQGE
jgi:hypothetical protein